MSTPEESKTDGASSTAKPAAESIVAETNPGDVAMKDATTTPVKAEDKKEEAKKEDEASPQKTTTTDPSLEDLPKNRFELELEFVQSLASPAYLHYLATNPSSDDHNWLDDPEFVEYLRYLLKVWTQPEYNRFLVYPQSLYFLEWMLNHRREEWAQIGFRNFAHQQQFHSWQYRASSLYGRGSVKPQPPVPVGEGGPADPNQEGVDPAAAAEGPQPEAMKEG